MIRNEYEQSQCPTLASVGAVVVVLCALSAIDWGLAYVSLRTCTTDYDCQRACYHLALPECEDILRPAKAPDDEDDQDKVVRI
jgi:hypothetical protein